MISMMRFSTYGHVAITLIIMTGIISSLILLPNWPKYSGSEYPIHAMAEDSLGGGYGDACIN
ncbi:hypothetical protein [Photorhabdus antumapuensis]|uniref:hypothetical protein n=1 Tax=Photorhabdus antumapuensis TaxID=2862867 RepID=UPI001CEC8AF2|nr:hypothetical protein [Photorhabdus antumapuensis]